MGKRGFPVKNVIVGTGYNEIKGLNKFKKSQSNKSILPKDYNGYSDATESVYKISGITLEDLYGSEKTV